MFRKFWTAIGGWSAVFAAFVTVVFGTAAIVFGYTLDTAKQNASTWWGGAMAVVTNLSAGVCGAAGFMLLSVMFLHAAWRARKLKLREAAVDAVERKQLRLSVRAGWYKARFGIAQRHLQATNQYVGEQRPGGVGVFPLPAHLVGVDLTEMHEMDYPPEARE